MYREPGVPVRRVTLSTAQARETLGHWLEVEALIDEMKAFGLQEGESIKLVLNELVYSEFDRSNLRQLRLVARRLTLELPLKFADSVICLIWCQQARLLDLEGCADYITKIYISGIAGSAGGKQLKARLFNMIAPNLP